LLTILLFSCHEFAENPDMISADEDWSSKIFSPELDPTGRIAFKNLASFSDFVEKNIKKPAEELQLFEGQFISLRKKNEELALTNPALLRIEDDDIEEDPIIMDDLTASIVNEKREVIIDGKVVRYTEFGTWVYHDYFTDRVEQLLLSTTTEEIEAIYSSHDFEEDPFYELEPGIFLFGTPDNGENDTDMELKTIDTSNAFLGPSWGPSPFHFHGCNRTSNKEQFICPEKKWNGGVRIIDTYHVRTGRRMKVKVWSTNYVTHATGGFQTRYQRRSAGIWWRMKADQISVAVRANIYYPVPKEITGQTGTQYYPMTIHPANNNHYINRPDKRDATWDFGIITATIGVSTNLHSFVSSGQLCQSENDFREDWGHTPVPVKEGEKPKVLCKPKWSAAKNVKIKESESCHFVRDGSNTKEVQISTKFND